MRSTRRLCSLIALVAAWATLAPPAAWSAQLEWIGGTDNSWHTPTNWAPIVVPGEDPIQRVPQDGDTVRISDTTHGSLVRLDSDSARLAGLTVEYGFELNTDGHFLLVENGGTAVTVVRGESTRLMLPSIGRDARAFQSDSLDVLESGTVSLLHSGETFNAVTVHVTEGAFIDSTSELSGRGSAIFGTEMTPDDTVVFRNEGTIRPLRTSAVPPITLSVRAASGGRVDLGGPNGTGVIAADGPGSVHFSNEAGANSIPFNGTVLIGADDFAYHVLPLDGATVHFNGQNGAPAVWFGSGGISGTTSIQVNSGEAIIEGPGFRMTDGSVRVGTNASLLVASADYQRNELTGLSFIVEDGSTFSVGSYEPVHLTFSEFDLDGNDGSSRINLSIFSSLTINASALDVDPVSPGFDGTILVQGGVLTMNVPGGWELDGRLEFDNAAYSEVRGTTITVDGGDPGDGIYYNGADYPATIYADLVLTQYARIEPIFLGSIDFKGAVTYLLRGDYNGNGQVEQGDLDLVLLNWGSDGTAPPATWTNDLPRGLIDQEELDNLLLHWGDDGSMFAGLPPEQGRVGQSGAVPEPWAIWLLLVLLLAGVVPKRWRRQTSMPQCESLAARRT